MNIYNNYTTTAENKYYQLIKTLIFVLEKRIVRFYQAKRCNQHKFFSILHKIIHKIQKYEQQQMQDTLFQDSVDRLLQEFSPFSQNQFKGISSMSDVSVGFDDKISQISYNSSFDELPRARFKARTEESDLFQSARRKKYHSIQVMKPVNPINQMDELFEKARSNSRSKFPEFKKIKMRIKPPKIAPYIQNIKEELLGEQNLMKKTQKKFTGQPYIGQRRKKQKKVIKIVSNH